MIVGLERLGKNLDQDEDNVIWCLVLSFDEESARASSCVALASVGR